MGHKSWGVVCVVAASVLLGACSSVGVGVGTSTNVGGAQVGVGVGTSTTVYDPQQERPGR